MAYHPVCFSGDEESTCFYCKRGTAQLRPGWRLSHGGYAQLCDECAIIGKKQGLVFQCHACMGVLLY